MRLLWDCRDDSRICCSTHVLLQYVWRVKLLPWVLPSFNSRPRSHCSNSYHASQILRQRLQRNERHTLCIGRNISFDSYSTYDLLRWSFSLHQTLFWLMGIWRCFVYIWSFTLRHQISRKTTSWQIWLRWLISLNLPCTCVGSSIFAFWCVIKRIQ